MSEKVQEMLKKARSAVQEAEQYEHRLREGLERKKADVIEASTNHTRLIVDNTKIERKLDLQSRLLTSQKAAGESYLSQVEKAIEEKITKIGAGLKDYDTGIRLQQTIAMEMLRQLRDLPLNLGGHKALDRVVELKQEQLQLDKILGQQADEIDEEVKKCEADKHLEEDPANWGEFARHLKIFVMKSEAKLPLKQKASPDIETFTAK